MSDVSKLEALLERVARNRRPAPPDLAQLLAGTIDAPPAREAVAAAPATAAPATAAPATGGQSRKAAPTPLEEAFAAPRREPTPMTGDEPEIEVVMDDDGEIVDTAGDFEDVQTGEFEVSQEELDARERADADSRAREAAEREQREARHREAAEREQRENAEREREAAQREAREREQREAREREQREARERDAREREQREAAQRENADREQREAREREQRENAGREQRAARERENAEREQREARERDAAARAMPRVPSPATSGALAGEVVEAVAPRASGPVARVSRPLDEPASTFRALMQRTLALRPRG